MEVNPAPFARKVSLYKGWQQLSLSLGCPVEEILTKASLPLEMADHVHVEMTRDQFFRFWNVMLSGKSPQELADWFLMLMEAGMAAPYLAALCSQDLRAAIKSLCKYKKVIAPITMSLVPCSGGESAVIDWGVDDVPPSLAFVELCALHHLAQKGTHRTITPLFAHVPNADQAMCEASRKVLGIPMEPGSKIQIAFAKADLDAEFPNANPVTLKILEASLQQQLSTVSEDWSEKLSCALKRLLADQRTSIEDAADALNCSVRTLQRKLTAENTSFKQMLDETRCELALFYLGTAGFSPKETSFLLGFSEPATFYRAFRRWTGITTSAYYKDPGSLNRLNA